MTGTNAPSRTTLDLGAIRGPVLAFGGPYGNLEATRAMRQIAEAEGFPPDRVICTGDIAAYCGDPGETLALIRRWGIHVLMGNCEESLGASSDSCGCGFEDGTTCDTLANQWYRYCHAAMDDDGRRWMATRPRQIRFRTAGARWAVVHGAASRINRFVFRSTARSVKSREMDLCGADAILAGHAGIPFAQRIGRRLWLNAGAIGLPANDGTPRTWYAVIEPSDDRVAVEIKPLSYDYDSAARTLRQRGLPEGYGRALTSGLWPSLSVLPKSERAMTGRPLAFRPVGWPRNRAASQAAA